MIEFPNMDWQEWNESAPPVNIGFTLKDLYILDNETGEWVDYRLYFEPEAQA